MNILGIEIGGTKLQLALGNEYGAIQHRRTLTVNPNAGAVGIREQMARAIRELSASHQIAAVGVGFGGPVDWRTGKICRSHQIEGWSDFDLSSWLHEQIRTPVAVDNDANVAALGEAHCGAGVGGDPVFYVTLGSGVGGGLVVAGQIYHGAIPGEAEIGHVRLDRRGTTVESRCSGWAVDARIRELIQQQPQSQLARLVGRETRGEARHLGTALAQGDPLAQQLLREISEDLAFGLSHVVHLFHPQRLILGGGLAGLGEPLRLAVENALRGWVMEAFRPGLSVQLSPLGADVVPVGALLLAVRAAKAD